MNITHIIMKHKARGPISGDRQEEIRDYLRDLPRIKLSADEARELAVAARGGDIRARNQLIEGHLRLGIAIAGDYHCDGVEFADLVGEANLALCEAANSYNAVLYPSTSFASWASVRIRQRLSGMCYAGKGGLGVSVNIALARVRVWKALDAYRAEHDGDDPDDATLCRLADVTPYVLKGVRQTGTRPLSLNKPVASADMDGYLTLGDTIVGMAAPDDDVTTQALAAQAVELMDRVLDKRERYVLRLAYGFADGGQCYTQGQIGESMGLTRKQVGVLCRGALAKLRDALEHGASEAA